MHRAPCTVRWCKSSSGIINVIFSKFSIHSMSLSLTLRRDCISSNQFSTDFPFECSTMLTFRHRQRWHNATNSKKNIFFLSKMIVEKPRTRTRAQMRVIIFHANIWFVSTTAKRRLQNSRCHGISEWNERWIGCLSLELHQTASRVATKTNTVGMWSDDWVWRWVSRKCSKWTGACADTSVEQQTMMLMPLVVDWWLVDRLDVWPVKRRWSIRMCSMSWRRAHQSSSDDGWESRNCHNQASDVMLLIDFMIDFKGDGWTGSSEHMMRSL